MDEETSFTIDDSGTNKVSQTDDDPSNEDDDNNDNESWSSYDILPSEDFENNEHDAHSENEDVDVENEQNNSEDSGVDNVSQDSDGPDGCEDGAKMDIEEAQYLQQMLETHWKVMAMTFRSQGDAYIFYNSASEERRAGRRRSKFITKEGRIRRLRPETRLHYENCIVCLHENKAHDDYEANQKVPPVVNEYKAIKEHAAKVFTPPNFYILQDDLNKMGQLEIFETLVVIEHHTFTVTWKDNHKFMYNVVYERVQCKSDLFGWGWSGPEKRERYSQVSIKTAEAAHVGADDPFLFNELMKRLDDIIAKKNILKEELIGHRRCALIAKQAIQAEEGATGHNKELGIEIDRGKKKLVARVSGG
ncbi:putative disease resistance protein RGA4 [Hordeum vulgare]|nr:putative disease resistance protein RGA4 [Hordeum vulgare]